MEELVVTLCGWVSTIIVTHMGLPLGRLPSHEGMWEAVLRATFPVTGLVIAFKLTGAPAIVEGTVAGTLLAKFHIIIDHLIWLCRIRQKGYEEAFRKTIVSLLLIQI